MLTNNCVHTSWFDQWGMWDSHLSDQTGANIQVLYHSCPVITAYLTHLPKCRIYVAVNGVSIGSINGFGAYSAPSHYLNQCWFIVHWTRRNKLWWNFNQNTKLCIHKTASEYIICEMATILTRGRWVNPSDPGRCGYNLKCVDFTLKVTQIIDSQRGKHVCLWSQSCTYWWPCAIRY